ncbi:MAG TPA: hypothetical protein VN703_07755 [Candidatus Sulfopaludibacter sp.]|nr:hypothetical protein [Candidatus Sulfopaludibacter sp.]
MFATAKTFYLLDAFYGSFSLSKYEWIYDDGIKGIRGTAGRLQGYQGNRWKVARVSGEPKYFIYK